MMEEIAPLENAVILDDPVQLFRNKGLQYGRSNVGMVGCA